MNIKYIISFASLLLGLFSGLQAQDDLFEDGGSFTDERDGNVYKVVQIGSQTWMADNLNFDDGNSWCYDDALGNGEKYGRLYIWESAMKVCPTGWHLPSDQEWDVLSEHIAKYKGPVEKGDGNWGAINYLNQGKYLKSTSGWYKDVNGTNEFGFNGLPGGMRNSRDGSFTSITESAYWWTSSEQDEKHAFRRYLYYSFDHLGRFDVQKDLGHSVRCLKD